MPVAPRTAVAQVSPDSGRPNIQRTGADFTTAFGGATGRALRKVGQDLQQVSDVATRMQIENNEREAKELDVAFTNGKREILYGDGTDANPGFYSSRGEGTLNQIGDVNERLNKLRTDLMDSATTDAAREMFGMTSAGRLAIEGERIARFTNEQRVTANKIASDARIKEAIDDSTLSGWADEQILQQSESIIENEVFGQAEDYGWSPEVTQSKLEEARTLLYRDTIVAAIKNGRLAEAQAVFDANKGKMDGPIAAEVKELLTSAEQTKEAQDTTDRIMSEAADAQEALAMARAIDDPTGALRDDVVNRVKRRLDENTQLRANQLKEVQGLASNFIYSGGTLDQFQQANPEAYELLKSDRVTMEALTKAQDNLAKGQMYARTSDGKTYAQLRTLPPEELAELDLSIYQSSLTETEYRQMTNAVAGAQASIRRTQSGYESYRRGETVLRQIAPTSFKWGKEKQSNKNRELQNQIVADMNAYIHSFTSEGKVPSNDDILREAQRLFSEVDIQSEGVFSQFYNLFGGESVYVAEAQRRTPEERATAIVPIDDLEDEVVTEIKSIYNEYGIVATDDLVEQFAGATLMNDTARKQALLGIGPSGVPIVTEAGPAPQQEVPELPQGTPEASVEFSAEEEAGQEEPTERPSEGPPRRGRAGPAPVSEVQEGPSRRGSVRPITTPEVQEGPLRRGGKRRQEAGVTDQMLRFTARNEGVHTRTYADSLGIPTVGVGFNLDRKDARSKIEAMGLDYERVRSGEQELSDEQVMSLFRSDLEQANKEASKVVSNFSELSPGQQMALTDMVFNLGLTRFRGFKRMISAIERGDFETAAAEAQDSAWFKQVGRRGPIIVSLIRNAT